MSKKLLVLVLAMVFVFAFATQAFAAWGNSTYILPSDIVSNTSGTPSNNPHGPYDSASRKCAVCHAVHGADAAGQQLLRAGTDPCIVCHITTAAGKTIVYMGQETNYTTSSEFAHNQTGAPCKGCHTVHGVGAATVDGVARNLKGIPAYTAASPRDGSATGAYRTFTASSVGAAVTQSQWCSGCHPYLNTAYNGATHIMTTDIAAYGNSVASSITAQVAWRTSDKCTSCHDSTAGKGATAGGITAGGIAGANFPHYTAGARFLKSGDSSAAAGVDVTAGMANYDGPCLKCHKADATTGVGQTY